MPRSRGFVIRALKLPSLLACHSEAPQWRGGITDESVYG